MRARGVLYFSWNGFKSLFLGNVHRENLGKVLPSDPLAGLSDLSRGSIWVIKRSLGRSSGNVLFSLK